VEIKIYLFLDDLRDKESGEIKCRVTPSAANAGENPAKHIRARIIDDVMVGY